MFHQKRQTTQPLPGAMVPLLSLGIPRPDATAVLLGAVLMWGLQPSPMLIVNDPVFVWGLMANMYLGNMILIAIRTFAMKKYGYAPPVTVFALVLGPMAEETFLPTYIISQGAMSLFWDRPVSLALSVVLLRAVVTPPFMSVLARFKANVARANRGT